MELIIGNWKLVLFRVERVKQWIVKRTTEDTIGRYQVVPTRWKEKQLKSKILFMCPDRGNKILPIKRVREMIREELGDNYTMSLWDAKIMVESWGYGAR